MLHGPAREWRPFGSSPPARIGHTSLSDESPSLALTVSPVLVCSGYFGDSFKDCLEAYGAKVSFPPSLRPVRPERAKVGQADIVKPWLPLSGHDPSLTSRRSADQGGAHKSAQGEQVQGQSRAIASERQTSSPAVCPSLSGRHVHPRRHLHGCPLGRPDDRQARQGDLARDDRRPRRCVLRRLGGDQVRRLPSRSVVSLDGLR